MNFSTERTNSTKLQAMVLCYKPAALACLLGKFPNPLNTAAGGELRVRSERFQNKKKTRHGVH